MPIAIAAVAVHVAVATITWRDIASRGASDVRGPNNVWRAASALNTLGSIASWAFGRVGASAEIEHVSGTESWSLDHDIESSRIHELVSNHPTEMSSFVRIVPESISGRRFWIARHGLLPTRAAATIDRPAVRHSRVAVSVSDQPHDR